MTIESYKNTLDSLDVEEELKSKLVKSFQSGVEETIHNVSQFLSIHCKGTVNNEDCMVFTFTQDEWRDFYKNL